MGQVIHIHSQRTFTEEEATQLLPIIKRITDRAAIRVEGFKEQLEWIPESEPTFLRIKGKLEFEIKRWIQRVSQLGCEPRGVWLVDFNAGEGWYSWRYGDDSLNFFNSHRSATGFGDTTQELLS